MFRETLSDTIKLSPAERTFVNEIAPGVIQANVARGAADGDAAGAAAATTVATAVTNLRKAHQSEVIRQLEQRGALDRSKLKPGQSNQQQRVGGAAQATADFTKGQQKAAELAERRGVRIPGQTTGN